VKLAVAVLVAVVVAAAPAAAKKPAFGPWDAGSKRDVVRQTKKGTPRAAHPMVGAPAKVPGEGPPPPPLRVSPDVPESALAAPNTVGGSLSSNPLWLASLVYSNLLTRLDGPRCQHLPTCSRFASQAVAKHGAIGILMGLDRLIATDQSSSVRLLPQVEGYGSIPRHFDPVENYEFWRPELFTGFPPPVPEVPLAQPAPAP
jgi:hypothetical protein